MPCDLFYVHTYTLSPFLCTHIYPHHLFYVHTSTPITFSMYTCLPHYLFYVYTYTLITFSMYTHISHHQFYVRIYSVTFSMYTHIPSSSFLCTHIYPHHLQYVLISVLKKKKILYLDFIFMISFQIFKYIFQVH